MYNLIENEMQYNSALTEIENLMNADPEPFSNDGKKLQFLTLLVKSYEKDLEIIKLPDPIEAIKFRMEQMNLTNRDLIPFIGSRSKVSEVLSKNRPLTLDMIRAINENLGIPFKVLVQEIPVEIDDNNLDWEKFPINEIPKRKWVTFNNKIKDPKIILNKFFEQLQPLPKFATFNRANHIRAGKNMDSYALYLWNVRLLIKAKEINKIKQYKKDNINKKVLLDLVKLSKNENGPLQAIDYLLDLGIKVVIEPHLPRTYLDGAVIFLENENPIIGLTIRYDRIDNFWFTLLHEIAHIILHQNQNIETFYDDLDVTETKDKFEIEADEFAREILVPIDEWEKSIAKKLKFPQAAEILADKLEIHPAIVAGKMRYEFKTYRILNHLIGNKQIRKLFDNII